MASKKRKLNEGDGQQGGPDPNCGACQFLQYHLDQKNVRIVILQNEISLHKVAVRRKSEELDRALMECKHEKERAEEFAKVIEEMNEEMAANLKELRELRVLFAATQRALRLAEQRADAAEQAAEQPAEIAAEQVAAAPDLEIGDIDEDDRYADLWTFADEDDAADEQEEEKQDAEQ